MRLFWIAIWLTLVAIPALAQTSPTPMIPAGPAGPPGPAGRSENSGGAGPPVDAKGQQAVDPTKNVEALVKALEEKTKELREADIRLIQSKLDSANLASELRSKNVAETTESNFRRVDEIERLRADLNEKLAKAETERINALRLVDVSAAADLQRRTSEGATALNTQTTQLANDLRTSTNLLADNLRTLVNNTAAAQLAAQKQDKDETSKRLATIEQALSEGRGKQQFQDPALIEMKAQMQVVTQQLANKSGSDKGQSDAIFYVLAALALGVPVGLAIYARGNKVSPTPYPPAYAYPPPPAQTTTTTATHA